MFLCKSLLILEKLPGIIEGVQALLKTFPWSLQGFGDLFKVSMILKEVSDSLKEIQESLKGFRGPRTSSRQHRKSSTGFLGSLNVFQALLSELEFQDVFRGSFRILE